MTRIASAAKTCRVASMLLHPLALHAVCMLTGSNKTKGCKVALGASIRNFSSGSFSLASQSLAPLKIQGIGEFVGSRAVVLTHVT